MNAIGWNGTLSKVSVGGLFLLLTISYEESRFWLTAGLSLLENTFSYGPVVTAGLVFCLTFGFGTLLTLPTRSPAKWEQPLSVAISLKNDQLVHLILEEKWISELLIGLRSAFALFAALGAYNLCIAIVFSINDVTSDNRSSWVQLISSIIFGASLFRLLGRVSLIPFDRATSLIGALQSVQSDSIKAKIEDRS